MYLYKIDKKTGKKYRITVPDWDSPIPQAGVDIGSNVGAPSFILSGSTGIFSWAWSDTLPTYWLLETSTDNTNWTTLNVFAGTVSSSVISSYPAGTFDSGVYVSVIGSKDVTNDYTTGRDPINAFPTISELSGSYKISFKWDAPIYWSIDTSTDSGATWTSYIEFLGTTASYFTSSFPANTLISVIGEDSLSGTYTTGRSNYVSGSF